MRRRRKRRGGEGGGRFSTKSVFHEAGIAIPPHSDANEGKADYGQNHTSEQGKKGIVYLRSLGGKTKDSSLSI